MKNKLYSGIFLGLNILLLMPQILKLDLVIYDYGIVDSGLNIAFVGFNIIRGAGFIYAILFVFLRTSEKCLFVLTISSIFLCMIMIMSFYIFFFLSHSILM